MQTKLAYIRVRVQRLTFERDSVGNLQQNGWSETERDSVACNRMVDLRQLYKMSVHRRRLI